MANLAAIVQQYPKLEALCRQLRPAAFAALLQTETNHRQLMRGQGRPEHPRTTAHPFQPVHRPCTCSKDLEAHCLKHGTPRLRGLLKNTIAHARTGHTARGTMWTIYGYLRYATSRVV
jgi:hypothetical protein